MNSRHTIIASAAATLTAAATTRWLLRRWPPSPAETRFRNTLHSIHRLASIETIESRDHPPNHRLTRIQQAANSALNDWPDIPAGGTLNRKFWDHPPKNPREEQYRSHGSH